jgi:hypothetical protein
MNGERDEFVFKFCDVEKAVVTLLRTFLLGIARSQSEHKPVCGRSLSHDEADRRVREHLKDCPAASIRQISKATGISVGRVAGLPAWKETTAQRPGRQGRRGKEIPLSRKMQAVIPTGADPADLAEQNESQRLADSKQVSWDHMISLARPSERVHLRAMSTDERAEILKLYAEQRHDQNRDDERS